MDEGRFNYELFVLAREARSVTQGQLAQEIRTSQGRISKVETGVLDPTEDFLREAAGALRVPVAFFFQNEDIRGLPESYHRKRMSLGATVLKRINAEVNIRMLQVSRLLRAADLSPEYSLPVLDLDEYAGSAEAVARAVRSFWQMPPGPVKNLARSLERAGAILIPMAFGVRQIDGIGMRPRGMPPLIFYNSAAPGDRTRFTLAHELGHLVMHAHQPPYPSMEEEANRFAAEFLMPERDMGPQLMAGVSRPVLAALKPVWKVAMSAILRRAHDLGAISKTQYTRLWREMGKMGYRTREPAELDFPQEQPTVLRDLLRLHIDELGYSLQELASATVTHPDVLQETLLGDRPHLRLHGDPNIARLA